MSLYKFASASPTFIPILNNYTRIIDVNKTELLRHQANLYTHTFDNNKIIWRI